MPEDSKKDIKIVILIKKLYFFDYSEFTVLQFYDKILTEERLSVNSIT